MYEMDAIGPGYNPDKVTSKKTMKLQCPTNGGTFLGQISGNQLLKNTSTAKASKKLIKIYNSERGGV